MKLRSVDTPPHFGFTQPKSDEVFILGKLLLSDVAGPWLAARLFELFCKAISKLIFRVQEEDIIVSYILKCQLIGSLLDGTSNCHRFMKVLTREFKSLLQLVCSYSG